MAKRQVVSYSYTCDVCGGTIPESDADDATRTVSWDSTDYVIDVCATDRSRLGEILTQLKGFVDAGHRESGRRGHRAVAAVSTAAPKAPRGRRVPASTSTSGTAPKRGDLGTVRAWARQNGLKVSERGRIPAALLAAYDEANSAPAPAPAEAPVAPAPRKRGPRKAAAAAAG